MKTALVVGLIVLGFGIARADPCEKLDPIDGQTVPWCYTDEENGLAIAVRGEARMPIELQQAAIATGQCQDLVRALEPGPVLWFECWVLVRGDLPRWIEREPVLVLDDGTTKSPSRWISYQPPWRGCTLRELPGRLSPELPRAGRAIRTYVSYPWNGDWETEQVAALDLQ